MEASITFDTAAAFARLDAIPAMLRPDQPGPFQDGLTEALDIIMLWESTRYREYEMHGGDWLDHAISTKLNKAYKAGYRRGHHPRGEPTAAEQVSSMIFPLLFETGTLEESLQNGSPFHERVFTPDMAIAQTNVEYAHFHQDGGEIPGRPPQRKFVVEPPQGVLEAAGEPIKAGLMAMIGGL